MLEHQNISSKNGAGWDRPAAWGLNYFEQIFWQSKNWKFSPGRRENGMGQEINKEIRGGSVATLSPQQTIVPLSHSPLSSKKSNFFQVKIDIWAILPINYINI